VVIGLAFTIVALALLIEMTLDGSTVCVFFEKFPKSDMGLRFGLGIGF